MNRYRTRLSLHIKHPTRDLSPVCSALGLKPRVIWKKGEERRTPKGRKLGGLRDASYCSIELAQESRRSLAKQTEAALERLEPHRAVLRRLSSTGGRISFCVGWFCDEHSGELFSTDLLRAMTRLRIALDLNIYLPDGK
jgi:hypothetical protein